MSPQAKKIYDSIDHSKTKLGDIRKIAKEIKIDHRLALDLWTTNEFLPRMLAILIIDKKQLDQESINNLSSDILAHELNERNQLTDWLFANQISKDKKLVSLIATWEHSPSKIQRRIFWYYQSRLRWTGKKPIDNTEELLSAIEKNLATEEPEVQWAMNFTAGQIGIFEPDYRARCITLGEELGLYKDEPVSRGCTPNYLPEFIRIEVEKRSN